MIRTLLIATALVSCVQPDEPELGTTEQGISCPLGYCGGNSPLLGPFRAEELSLIGAKNDSGVELRGFVKSGTNCSPTLPCKIEIADDQLFVRDNNGVLMWGPTLVNGYLSVWQPGDPNYAPPIPPGLAKIHFMNESNATTFWQPPYEPVETFELMFEIPGIVRGPVCATPPNTVDDEGNVWLRRSESLFYTGDRYDHKKMAVIASTFADTKEWFNIACAGSATAKLHLNRHTSAGEMGSNIHTGWKERQAMLKMFTGDFCGTGVTYTVQGTKIAWGSSTGLSGPQVSGINSFESYWDYNGAICMTRHRLASSQNPDEAALEKTIRTGYENTPATCRKMPTCSRTHALNAYLTTRSGAMP